MADKQTLKNIGIIGRGAIGVDIAFHLQNAENINTTLLLRKQHDISNPLFIKVKDGETHHLNCEQTHLSEDTLSQLDLLVIPVKQYQLKSLLQTISPIVQKHTVILLLHNGMGGIELAEKHLPNNPLLVATTTDGVYKTSDSTFVQTAIGQFDIGPVDEKTLLLTSSETSLQFIKQLHPNFNWRVDIIFALYQKLAVNAVINPLTALKNCKNGELSKYQTEVNCIKEEIFDLYEFMNLPIDNHTLSQHIDDVIQLTANNYSSMHQDFHHGRETEVDGILGFLLEKGQETGMKLNFIQELYNQIVRKKKA